MAAAAGFGFGDTTVLQNELVNDYSYRVEGIDSQYDFNHVQHQPPPTAYTRTWPQQRLPSRGALTGQAPPTRGQRAPEARPMTSNRAAGYKPNAAQTLFDPMNSEGQKETLRAEVGPEDKLREMEREIHRLVEESAVVREQHDFREALERAKEAAKRERALCRMREQQNLLDQLNIDLTYAVCLNLAIQHHANGNTQEALSIYTQIVKNKQYPYSGRFRVNMGNMYFAQQKYPGSIKMYRMALDQIPNNCQSMRFKIMRNIGHAFFKMHQFPDAIDSYENLLLHGLSHLDFMTGFNLILCYYALGDKDKMKSDFLKLLNIQQVGLEDMDDDEESEWPGAEVTGGWTEDKTEGDDALREDIKRRQREAARYIVNAANLIAPVLDRQGVVGYDWVIDTLNSHGFPGIASELEIAKASYFLRRKEFDEAIAVLKTFERKEASLMARAATNVSFLYFLEGDYQNAEKYADVAVKADRYNARALVNKGNCMFVQGEFERSKEVFLEAIGVSADCLEAIYNLGLVNIHIGKYQEALLAFDKLHSITHNNCEVMWQLGDIHEKLGNTARAHEWFSLLVTSPKGRPTDPGVLARLANLFTKCDDETQAFHYHLESYRYWPTEMNVITWLGIYYVKQEMYEAAVPFFARAAQIQPQEAKWLLMVASCYRRMGVYRPALKLYQEIHKQHPRDVECLRYLITICKEMKEPHDEYAHQLRKLERMEEVNAQQQPDRERFEENNSVMHNKITELDDDMDENVPHRANGLGDGLLRAESKAQASKPMFNAGDVPQKSPGRRLGGMNMTNKLEDDDDWGDDELGEDLLPM
eukprot:GEMP01008749.1.p1 GENE.GEMP01008749.1~~GEMP01008749.1.p1  ORF type:complete len:815 (+),score=195.88 GEMP01008749.1:33-2477(+)